ncbi:MAG: hypothetical protein H6620_06035 [Halobacteriovoraceae bacterium]|nr:hypothetical protein [Halobacteriovoraceae bacterium]
MQIQTTAQIQAYLNEYKGNLFEFLVAQQLARYYGSEKVFLSGLETHYLHLLQSYEHSLREFSKDLPTQLVVLKEAFWKELQAYLKNKSFQKVELVGKFSSDLAEADILLSGTKNLLLSLKLCKSMSFINTKSAGIKSFFSTYFQTSDLQKKFNEKIDYYFNEMARELHAMNDLEFDGDFKRWQELGLPSLPGHLPPEENSILLESYYKMANELHATFLEILDNYGKKIFLKCLQPLMGFGRPDIVKAICFHSGTGKHEFKKAVFDECCESEDFKVDEYKENHSSFEIQFAKKILQIRIKPMNTFTAPSFKINCSVKHL